MTDEPRFVSTPVTSGREGIVHWAPVKSAWITLMSVLGVGGALASISAQNILVFGFTTAITICLGHSLGMHRLLIHRSWETIKPIEYVFVWLGVLVGMAGPEGMVRTHDLRDWAQRQPHCHDYFAHRQPWYLDGWWQLHCDVRLQNPPSFEPEAAVARDPVYGFMERYWMAQQLVPAVILGTLGGWEWVVWGVALRVSVSNHGHWIIGYCAHNRGHRDWHVHGAGVQGYNVAFGGPLCGLITMGECWHNNHHAFPGAARIGLTRGQWDPGWCVLRTMEKLGLAWHIVRPDRVPHRSCVQRIDVGADVKRGTPLSKPPAIINKPSNVADL